MTTIVDSVSDRLEEKDLGGGKGGYAIHWFFRGSIAPTMFFADMVFDPGAYAGLHRHDAHDTILYVLSGTGEHYQDDERRVLGAGDAVLVKAGHPHALKNIGEKGLRVVEFASVPAGRPPPSPSYALFPLPAELADWR